MVSRQREAADFEELSQPDRTAGRLVRPPRTVYSGQAVGKTRFARAKAVAD